MDENSKLSRRGFVALTGAASLSALLAACGGGEEAAEPAAGRARGARRALGAGGPGRARRARSPDLRSGERAGRAGHIFEWAGYDDTAPWMWQTYTDSEYNAGSPLKFEFLENDIQALAKVASGYSGRHPSVHRLLARLPGGRLIQPFDTALLPDLEGSPRTSGAAASKRTRGSRTTSPFDIGFSSLVYRADKIPITPEEESWSLSSTPRMRASSRRTPTRSRSSRSERSSTPGSRSTPTCSPPSRSRPRRRR